MSPGDWYVSSLFHEHLKALSKFIPIPKLVQITGLTAEEIGIWLARAYPRPVGYGVPLEQRIVLVKLLAFELGQFNIKVAAQFNPKVAAAAHSPGFWLEEK